MGLRVFRRVHLPDGRLDEFEPALNSDGYYVLSDLAVHPKHNVAANQFYVKDLAAVAARLRKGGVRLRMKGTLNPHQRNLISAREIEIEETPDLITTPSTQDDDPFATFTEWSGEADDHAYASL